MNMSIYVMVKHESEKRWLTCFIWYKWSTNKIFKVVVFSWKLFS